MATNTAPATPVSDPFRESVDAVVGGDILIDLHRVARILNLPSKDAVRRRITRGTLSLRTIQPGGETAPTLVPAADVYLALGLAWTPPAPGTQVLATVLADGSVEVTTDHAI